MKTFAHYSNSADPSDGYSNHPDNAPDLDEDQCPECFSYDTWPAKVLVTNKRHKDFGKKVDGRVCDNCGHEF